MGVEDLRIVFWFLFLANPLINFLRILFDNFLRYIVIVVREGP